MPPRDGEPDAPTAASGSPRRELEALRDVRESARALLEEGKVEEAWEFFLAALEAVLRKNRDLELLVAKLRRVRIGMTSERMDPAQLALLFDAWLEHGGPDAPVDLEAEAKEDTALDREIERAEQAQPGAKRKPRTTGPGWRTPGVQREVHRVEVPEAERTCGGCGRAMKPIGEDVSRRLEYVPAHFVEHEYHREKYACGSCKDGVTTAPAPPPVLERSAAGASLLAHVVVSKYADHTPLHPRRSRGGDHLRLTGVTHPKNGCGDLDQERIEEQNPERWLMLGKSDPPGRAPTR
jgi:transposase